MNILLISLLAIGVASFLPLSALGKEAEEKPRALPVAAAPAPELPQNVAGEVWQEDDREVLIRSVRGAKNNGGSSSGKREKDKARRLNGGNRKLSEPRSELKNEQKTDQKSEQKVQKKNSTCRYDKSQWSECDQQSNMRSRTLTLKKGDDGCVPTRTIQKKCKKACRYEKGEWSKCANGTMARTDKIKPGLDSTCKPTREVTKNCGKDKKQKKQNKEARNKSRA